MSVVAYAFWRRLDIPGCDAAKVIRTASGFELVGQSVYLDQPGPTAIKYLLDLEESWATRSGRITGFIGERQVDTSIARTPSGWVLNGHNFGMADIVDLDLGFTPATNMVQLKRKALEISDAASFDVAWLEAGDQELVRLPQEYKRVSETSYAYNSPTAHYQATIVVAPNGFAAEYPGLWRMQKPESAA